jgi:hypothetical protein
MAVTSRMYSNRHSERHDSEGHGGDASANPRQAPARDARADADPASPPRRRGLFDFLTAFAFGRDAPAEPPVNAPGPPDASRAARLVTVGPGSAGMVVAIVLAVPVFWIFFVAGLVTGRGLLVALMLGWGLGLGVLAMVALFALFSRLGQPDTQSANRDTGRYARYRPDEWLRDAIARPINRRRRRR